MSKKGQAGLIQRGIAAPQQRAMPNVMTNIDCVRNPETGRGLVSIRTSTVTFSEPLDLLRHLKKHFPDLWQQVNVEVEIAQPKPSGLALPEHVVNDIEQEKQQAAG